MPPKPSPKSPDTSQLGLPFVQGGPAHDLSYYIGICTVFATYHKRWPTIDATREEFRAARILGYDGRRLAREVRFPGAELAADPAYRALRERCRSEGNDDCMDLAMLDPRYRSVLPDEAVAQLLEALTLAGDAPGEVRYATGVVAHAPGELTLLCGEAIRTRAVAAAGLDAADPVVLRQAFSVRVRATDELKGFIDRTGMTYRSTDGPLADHYRLEAGDDGRLAIAYRMLAGSRYVGSFDVECLTARLAGMFAARPGLPGIRPVDDDAGAPDAAGAPQATGDDELRRQLGMLVLDGRSVKLPIQALSRLPDIRRLLEEAGGEYRPLAQQFDFPDGFAASDVLERLAAGRGG